MEISTARIQSTNIQASNVNINGKTLARLNTEAGMIHFGIASPKEGYAKLVFLDPATSCSFGTSSYSDLASYGFYNYWKNPSLPAAERRTTIIGDPKSIADCQSQLKREMENSEHAAICSNAGTPKLSDYFEFIPFVRGTKVSIQGNGTSAEIELLEASSAKNVSKFKIAVNRSEMNFETHTEDSQKYLERTFSQLQKVQLTGTPGINRDAAAVQIIGSSNLLSPGVKTTLAYHTVGSDIILIDCGATVPELLERQLDLQNVRHIFLSHLHIDHTAGLPDLLTFRAKCFTEQKTTIISTPENLEDLQEMLKLACSPEDYPKVMQSLDLVPLVTKGKYAFETLDVSGVKIEASRVRHLAEKNEVSQTLSCRLTAFSAEKSFVLAVSGDTKLGTSYFKPELPEVIARIKQECLEMDQELAQILRVENNSKTIQYIDAGGDNHGIVHPSRKDVNEYVEKYLSATSQNAEIIRIAGHCNPNSEVPNGFRKVEQTTCGMILK